MPEYAYVARDRSGKSASGVVVAEDDAQLRHILRSNDLFVTQIKAKGGIGKEEGSRSLLTDWNLRPKQQDLVIASRQMATMLRAGVPLVGALEIIESQTIKPALMSAFADVRRGVMDGEKLSDTMRRHAKIFPTILISLVSAGETSGELDRTLEIAADQIDREVTLKKKIKAASAYPKVVVAASAGTVAAMLTFVVPVFDQVYKQLHTQLPAATRMLMSASDATVHYGWLVCLIGASAFMGYKNLRKSEVGLRWTDRLWLRIPIFGQVWRKLVIARFVQTLAGALRGGVPIITALQISSKTSGNAIIEDAITEATEKVRDGASLGLELEQTGEFPRMVTRMLAAGEATGNVDEVLEEINRFYERDVNQAIETLTRMMEPAMTVLLGGLVMLILTALYMPIFNIGKALTNSK